MIDDPLNLRQRMLEARALATQLRMMLDDLDDDFDGLECIIADMDETQAAIDAELAIARKEHEHE